ncbi:MAG TPA: hypothetical protein VH139_08230 [Acidobacteriaceae bacterium]|jgi:hypothetical protein|nr:hypothetical protein [Acidobacteriaceae bacterium]
MFVRKLRVEYVGESGLPEPCPLAWIDNFAMRNFTNSAVFDDTLPIADGRLEVGLRVPMDALTLAMEDWFRRKGYLEEADRLVIEEE